MNHDEIRDLELVTSDLKNKLKPEIAYLNDDGKELIELAFVQMVLAHKDIKRKSGEFYIIHPVAACITLARIKMDATTLAATLLHDVPEDTEVTLKDLQKDFGSELAFLVEGVTKLSAVKYQGEERYAENLRRMFVAMSKDLRVILIKLADRLHNLQTLQHVDAQKRYRIALESLEIYAPIAERLGISKLQSEIEETSFPYIFPDIYKQFVQDSDLEINKRNQLLEKVINQTKLLLESENIYYTQVYGRSKKYYSIFKKTSSKNQNLQDIYDLVALRIVVRDIADCYFVMSVIQDHFDVDPARVKDYVAHAKPNGYQSLHLTAKDNDSGLFFEFQIRTQEMHEFAEYGVASHFIYKSTREKRINTQFLESENLKWIKELVDLGQEKLSPEEYLKNVKLDLFQDRIFVMTPKNDAIDLPHGATCLDFAYRIHADIGNHALMAKINGDIARLGDKLQNGDVVEILTDKRQHPNTGWINFVKTRHARAHIRSFLRQL